MLDDNIKIIAEKLMKCYDKAYEIYEPQVRMIIDNRITDINYIERTLDGCLDIYTEKGFYLFIELLLYYQTVNPLNAKEYLEILKEYRQEEYIDFTKSLKKI